MVQRGLAIAWNGGHRRVQLTVDSEVFVLVLVLVRMLMDLTPSNSPFIHIIEKMSVPNR